MDEAETSAGMDGAPAMDGEDSLMADAALNNGFAHDDPIVFSSEDDKTKRASPMRPGASPLS